MKFTILHSNDRLNPNMKDNSMLTDSFEDQLLSTIELLNLQLMDQADAAQEYKKIHDNLVLRNQELEARRDSYEAIESNRLLDLKELAENRQRINQLEKDLKTEVGNRDHFRSLVSQQDAFLKELKVQIEQWKADKLKELQTAKDESKSKSSESEHLARKAVEQHQRIEALEKENNEFRQSNNRLLEENRKFHDQIQDLDCGAKEHGSLCGGCLSCQLSQAQHTIQTMDERLTSKMEQISVYLKLVDLHQGINALLRSYVVSRSRKMFGSSEPKNIMAEVALLNAQISEQFDKLLGKCNVPLKEVVINKDADYELPTDKPKVVPTIFCGSTDA